MLQCRLIARRFEVAMFAMRSSVRVVVLLALAFLAGCGGIRVHRTNGAGLFDAWRESVLTCSDLSPRTAQTLRQFDLARVYERSPSEASVRLHAEALRDPRPDLLFALSEINSLRAKSAERRSHPEAVGCYYLCAGYAYHYLFDTPPPLAQAVGRPSSFDPRH